jgi:hypothetical protein
LTADPQLQRLTFKRLRISEEETEYSSKQSQIGPRGGSDGFEGTEHPRRNECGRTKTAFLQLSSESSKSLTSANKLTHSAFLLTHPHCNPVAPLSANYPQTQPLTLFAKREIPSATYSCSENPDCRDRERNNGKKLSLVKEGMMVGVMGRRESGEWERKESEGREGEG